MLNEISKRKCLTVYNLHIKVKIIFRLFKNHQNYTSKQEVEKEEIVKISQSSSELAEDLEGRATELGINYIEEIIIKDKFLRKKLK